MSTKTNKNVQNRPKNGQKQQNKSKKRNGAQVAKNSKGSVAAPIAFSKQRSTVGPKIVASSSGRRIIHKELVGSVNGSVAFSAVGYDCNPGIAATFPWLSVQAAQYEQYTFHKLHFELNTRTATTTVGSILLAPDYDPSDAPPASEAAMSAYEDCVEDVPWRDQVCRLSRKAMFPTGPRKFVRSAAVAGDIKLYDAARFYTGAVDETGTTPIGKLWVCYDVEFFVPQTSVSVPAATQTSIYEMTAAQTFATGIEAPFLTDAAQADPLRIGALVAGSFTPPAGAYVVRVSSSFSDTAAEAFSARLRILKNGAAIGTGGTSQWTNASAAGDGAGQTVSLGTSAYLVMNGTDTCSFVVTLTGAAGTLTAVAQSTFLTFSLA